MNKHTWKYLKKHRLILDEWIEDEDAIQLTWAVQKFVSGYLGGSKATDKLASLSKPLFT